MILAELFDTNNNVIVTWQEEGTIGHVAFRLIQEEWACGGEANGFVTLHKHNNVITLSKIGR